VTNHPNRGPNPNRPGRTPRPEEIIALRAQLGLTQTQAGKVIHASLKAWQQWEAGDRRMHPAFWELFRKKTRASLPAAAPAPAAPEPPTKGGEPE